MSATPLASLRVVVKSVVLGVVILVTAAYYGYLTYELLSSHLRFLKKLGNEDRPGMAGF